VAKALAEWQGQEVVQQVLVRRLPALVLAHMRQQAMSDRQQAYPYPIYAYSNHSREPIIAFSLSTGLTAENKACIGELRKEKGPVVSHRAFPFVV
jgi:hypothetical protein